MAKNVNFEEVCGGPYFRCLKCGTIILAVKKSKKDDSSLPKCACSNYSSCASWPSESVAETLKVIACESIATKTDQITTVLLTEAIVRLLFRDLINGVAKYTTGLLSFPKNVTLSFPVEEAAPKIIEDITGLPLDSLFESKGFGDFIMGWKLISNTIGNTTSRTGTMITENEVDVSLQLAANALRVFSVINNEVMILANKVSNPNSRALLIVDDDEEITMKIARYMAKKGLTVFTAHTGKEAVELFKEKLPGYVLLDMALPDMDGVSVLKKILSIDKTAKVYFVTGIAGETFIKQIKNIGAVGHIAKPIALDSLYYTLLKK